MAKTPQTYICKKCGTPFVYWSGGIVLTSAEQEMRRNPVCTSCKIKKVIRVFAGESNII